MKTNPRLHSAIGLKPRGVRLQTKAQLAQGAVDREAGIIRGYSVISVGELRGHYGWADAELLAAVIAAGNAKPNGIKSRYTHPGLSSDGMGTLLGRTKNFSLAGDRVIGDLHFDRSAYETPNGNLAKYVMDLAEESPDLFGASIVLSRDIGEEEKFRALHLDKDGRFVSPDPKNENGLTHWRLAELIASDIVDDPASNPQGFLSALSDGNRLPHDAEAVLEFAFGLRSVAPEDIDLLGVNPERVRLFVGNFLERHQLSVTGAPAPTNPTKEDPEMDLSKLTLEELKSGRPDLVEALKKDGVEGERKRALSIIKQADQFGMHDLAAGQIEKGTPELEALNALKDEKIARLEKGTPANPGPSDDPDKEEDEDLEDDEDEENLEGEDEEEEEAESEDEDKKELSGSDRKWAKQYKKDPKLRAEFGSLRAFLAFKRAEVRGRVRGAK